MSETRLLPPVESINKPDTARKFYFAFPEFSFFGLAPFDVWLRFLRLPAARIPVRYWLRVAASLCVSFVATLPAVPERILTGLFLRLRPFRPHRFPGPVFVLGYYRSGTTHLQQLLACDPKLFTPRFYHALLPYGFLVSWTSLRLISIPFFLRKRPMDGISLSPDSPAEDEFATNNWCLSSPLIGKYVLPDAYEEYDRYRTLEGLSPREHSRWRSYQLAFLRKVGWVAGRRRLLLKSPSHVAHVEELLDLLDGVPDMKFIHISRRPAEVVASNVRMHALLQGMWGLQDPMSYEQLLDVFKYELIDSEERYLKARAKLAPGQLIEVRYEDLRADPVGVVRRMYGELGLPWTDKFERRMITYLESVRDYRPGTSARELRSTETDPDLQKLEKHFGHDRPAGPSVPLPEQRPRVRLPRPVRAFGPFLAALVAGAACGGLWWWLAQVGDGLSPFVHQLVWPTGLAVGYTALYFAKGGSRLLGSWSALITAAVFLIVVCGSTVGAVESSVSDSAVRTQLGSLANVFTSSTIFWTVMGVVSAYRLGSRPLVP